WCRRRTASRRRNCRRRWCCTSGRRRNRLLAGPNQWLGRAEEELLVEAVRAKLDALGYRPGDWQLPVTDGFVAGFERDYDLRLPVEYRNFLLQFGGWVGSATCEFLEQPTPRGDGAWIDLFYGRMLPEYKVYDIRWATGSVGEAPAFVAVASGGM